MIFRDSNFYLRELRQADLAGNWYRWLNDPEVTKHQNKGILPNSLEKQTAYYQHLQSSSADVVLAICDSKTERHIGNVGLHKIDWIHRSAELGIVIGEKEFWGRGIGKGAWRAMTDYGFQKLNLHRLYAHVVVQNESSRKAAEAAGFKVVGTIDDFLFKDGQYLDAYFMNCVRRDVLGSSGQ